ncbi:copper resistance CopC family protein [Nocardia crassostreae]|uniref:copper resistance CopC family protein n=1 Tax=Nocardia crassostreae TaxID=53428 RepID=UPI0008375A6F|nr:copper resistance CopC family protein [Nocardia crassostreae]
MVKAQVVALFSTLALFWGAGVAMAHTELTEADPASGAVLGTAPERVTLTFSQSVDGSGATLTITGPAGDAWAAAPAEVSGAQLKVPLRSGMPPGQYTVSYLVRSEDGHSIHGLYGFTLAGPPPTAPPTATTPAPATTPTAPPQDVIDEKDYTLLWFGGVAAVLAVAMVAGVVFINKR